MGLKRAYLDFIERAAGPIAGKRMLELGNQRISRRAGAGARTGHAYYTALGAEHMRSISTARTARCRSTFRSQSTSPNGTRTST